MAQNDRPRRDSDADPHRGGKATTMRLPSVWGSFLMLVPAVLLGSSNLPALVALVVICGIWIWYEAKS